jgi:hypothetical protein
MESDKELNLFDQELMAYDRENLLFENKFIPYLPKGRFLSVEYRWKRWLETMNL